MEASKKPWLSKTIWLGVVTALSPFVPGVSEWISNAAHIETIGMIWGALAVLLRFITKDKVSLGD